MAMFMLGFLAGVYVTTAVLTGVIAMMPRSPQPIAECPDGKHDWEHDDFVWKETCLRCGVSRPTHGC